MIPETILLCGVCILYITYGIQYCTVYKRSRQHMIETRRIHSERIYLPNHTIVTIAPTSPITMLQPIDIETIAPLDETEPIETDNCSICFEDLKDVKYRRKTTCGHVFCSECIREWLHRKTVCPLCMTKLN